MRSFHRPASEEIRDLLPTGLTRHRTKEDVPTLADSQWCNWSFTIPIGLLLLMSATNIGLNAATFSMVHDEQNSTSGPSFLFGVDVTLATMKPKGGGCEVVISNPTTTTQIYQFVDRPYRGMSKTLTPTEFASLWNKSDSGNSFYHDPPNTAVKRGGVLGFNTVEIVDATATATKLTLTLRKPTARWGGPNPEDFCKATTEDPMTLFVDPGRGTYTQSQIPPGLAISEDVDK